MKYAKINNGIVVQVQPDSEIGFIECPDNVSCGCLYDGSNFTNPDVSIDQMKGRAIDHVHGLLDSQGDELKGSYPRADVESWPIQLKEAEAWTANNSANIPYITQKSADTGQSIADLVAKILAKADAHCTALAALSATKDILCDNIPNMGESDLQKVLDLTALQWPLP